MKIYFLGTGTSQGIPIIGSDHPVCKSTDAKDKRLRVSAWVSWENHSFVFDCGPDFRQQMLVSNCQKVDGILFTHEHADHTAGIDDIRPFNFRQGPMPIYAHQRVVENLKNRFDYVFETVNKYPGAPSVVTFEVQNNQDYVLINLTRCKSENNFKSNKTYYNALNELKVKCIICSSAVKHVYFINPRLFFCGNRTKMYPENVVIYTPKKPPKNT